MGIKTSPLHLSGVGMGYRHVFGISNPNLPGRAAMLLCILIVVFPLHLTVQKGFRQCELLQEPCVHDQSGSLAESFP